MTDNTELLGLVERLEGRAQILAGYAQADDAELDRAAVAALRALMEERGRLAAKVAGFEEDLERQSLIETDIAGGTDRIDSAADHWLALVGVDRMVAAICSVFSCVSDEGILSRFREKVRALMHQAFVEGAIAGSQVSGRAALAIDDQANAAEAERDRLKADIIRLHGALERYARHDGLCGIVGGYGYCTCGFDAALSVSPVREGENSATPEMGRG